MRDRQYDTTDSALVGHALSYGWQKKTLSKHNQANEFVIQCIKRDVENIRDGGARAEDSREAPFVADIIQQLSK